MDKIFEILNLKQKTAFGKNSVIGHLSLNKSVCLGIGINQITLIGLQSMFVRNWEKCHIGFQKICWSKFRYEEKVSE